MDKKPCRDEWTGELLKQMHINRVKRIDLADAMGVKKSYITMLLNCDRSATDKTKQRMIDACNSLIEARSSSR